MRLPPRAGGVSGDGPVEFAVLRVAADCADLVVYALDPLGEVAGVLGGGGVVDLSGLGEGDKGNRSDDRGGLLCLPLGELGLFLRGGKEVPGEIIKARDDLRGDGFDLLHPIAAVVPGGRGPQRIEGVRGGGIDGLGVVRLDGFREPARARPDIGHGARDRDDKVCSVQDDKHGKFSFPKSEI